MYIVPLDINHDRVLILTNSSNTNTSVQTLCSSNWNKAKQSLINGLTVVRVPEYCSIVSKSFEISKMNQKDSINVKTTLGEVYEIEMHQVKSLAVEQSYVSTVTPLPHLDRIVDLNNNASIQQLSEIDTSMWSKDRIMITSSSSLSIYR